MGNTGTSPLPSPSTVAESNSRMTFASEVTKDYAYKYLVGVRYGRAHREGDIHIHDLDYYPVFEVLAETLQDARRHKMVESRNGLPAAVIPAKVR